MAKKVEIEGKEIAAPYELPDGWKWTRLGDVCEIARGGSPRPIEKYITTAEDGINWIKIGDTEKDGKYIFSTKEKIIKEGLAKSRYVEDGDFLLTNSMSFGRPYILKTSGCIHDGWLVIKKCSAYNQDFLYYLLSSPLAFQKFSEIAKGSTVKNLKSETVRQVVLPLPPLAEQQRIVARIESMFAKLDEATEKAQSALYSFETRKAAILHKAFTGELTAKWRKDNGVSDDSWEEKTLSDVCTKITDGFHNSPEPVSNGYPYIMAGDIKETGINFNNGLFMDEKNHRELYNKAHPEKGDILIVNIGAGTGKSAIIAVDFEFSFKNCAILKLDKKIVLPQYVFYSFNLNKEYILKEITRGGAQPFLSLKMINKMTITYPTLPEQQEIVRILDSVLEKERSAKEAAETVLSKIALLKKSILARAFRGAL